MNDEPLNERELASDIRQAVQVGLHAVEYMADSLSHQWETFYQLGPHDKSGTSERLTADARSALVQTLAKVDDLLQFVGDVLNAKDGISEDDMKATAHAYAKMRRVRKYIAKTATQ